MSLNPSTANVFYLTLRQSDWVSLDSSAQQPVFGETFFLDFNRVFLSYTYFSASISYLYFGKLEIECSY